MPKKLLFSLIIFIALVFNYSNNNSLAYDDQTTHPALTDEIVDFYNLSFPDKKLTPQQKEWIIEGSILEDTPPRWINHFYDPINKSGWSGENAGKYDAETVQLISKNIIAPYGIIPVSSLDWLHNGQLQAQYGFYKGIKTWEQGILEMIKGNEKKAYQILGYILHLIEDATVPDHTRNDTHAHELEKYTNDYGSPYEEYAKNYTRQNLDIALKFYQQGLRPINRTTIDDYLISLATYSNNYFFSKDTINDIKYQNPKIIRDDGIFGYGKDENGKEFILAKIKKEENENNKFNFQKTFVLEPVDLNIIEQYFSRLSRQAVLNGAGVIDLFRNEIEFKKEYSPHVITYDFSIFNNFEIPNISVAGEGYKITSTFKSLWAQISSFTSNVFSSVNNLFGAEQTSPDSEVVSESINFSTEIEGIENSIAEQPVTEEHPIITSEQIEPKEETKSQEIILKPEEIISNQQTKQIVENENSQTISEQTEVDSGQSIATTTKVIFKLTSSGDSGSSGSISYGGSYVAPSAPITYPKILITEIQLSSASSTYDEFVELYNPNDTSVDLINWYVQKKTASGSSFSTFAKADLFSGKTISAKSFLLIAHSSSTFVYDIAADYGISDDNTLVIKNPNGEIVDKVGLGEANDCDGSCASNPADGQSAQRKIQSGDFIDTDSNASDFEIQTCPSPKAQSASCQEENQTATSTISHIVISEIYPDKTGNNFDFVELYNPNNSSIEIGNYSLKIRKESATSASSLASFSSSHTIAAKSFFLIGLDNYGSSTNATADVLRSSYSLFTSTSSIVYLMDNDAVVDEINYNPANIANSQSLERKAYSTSTAESMITGEHRFSGNSYDVDSADDFILRSSAESQNSQSFSEPRTSPTTPTDFSVQYSSSTMSLNLSWQASQDYSGATSTITYKITDISASSTFSEINTTSTAASISINEIGRDYNFSIQAFDKEGLNSASSTAAISVPSFLSSLYFYQDSRASSTDYLIETYYNQYPFVSPDYYQNPLNSTWKIAAFYLNSDTAKENNIYMSGGPVWQPSDSTNVLRIKYKRCSSDSVTPGYSLILPDTASNCGTGGGIMNSAFAYSELENNHFIIQTASTTNNIVFTSSDYLTVVYYSVFQWTIGGDYAFKLAAADKTKYYFQNSSPSHFAPELSGDISLNFDSQNSQLTINWPRATDSDTLNSNLSYEIRYSSSSEWQSLGNATSTVKSVAPGDNLQIEVRTKDDFGNYSSALSSQWSYPEAVFYISQINTDNWSYSFGTRNINCPSCPDSASLQSITPENDFQFNKVVLRLWQNMVSDDATVRLSVYSDNSNSPNFSNNLGTASISNLLNPDKNSDKTFSFSSLISLSQGNKYWFVLDVSGYSDYRGFNRNSWENAIYTASDSYSTGQAGKGVAGSCPNQDYCTSFSVPYPNSNADWYMKIGWSSN